MNGLTGSQLAQNKNTELAPKSEMCSALESLFCELGSMSSYITSLENKLLPVLMPVGEGKSGGAPATPIAPEAPYLTQLRNARQQVIDMSARLEKMRDTLVG